jgi:glutamine amidotransferase PdxT
MYKTQVIVFLFVLVFASACNLDIKKYTETQPENINIKIQVGVFDGNGAGAISVIETIEALRIDTGIYAFPISAVDIQKGKLNNIDVLIFPGGSGSKELNNLGQTGKEKVIDFVKNHGKGVVGICAGAYLLSSTAGYPSIAMASSIHIDRKHYNRGRGLVQFDLTSQGLEIFPELEGKEMFVQYYDGPVLSQSDSIESDYNEVATFITDIHPDNYAPEGITPGSTFGLNENIGNGKLFIFAGHPESTPGMRWLIPRMVRWVSSKDLVSYDEKWIRPEINNKPILFDRELRKEEKKLFWQLYSDNTEDVINAMNSLNTMRSRPAVRWNIGLLRHKNVDVRRNAAKLIAETEYTYALKDLNQAFKNEQNSDTKKVMKNAIMKLDI